MDDFDLIFSDFDEEQMSELLEDIPDEYDEQLSERIKESVIPLIAGEPAVAKSFSLRKVVGLAAAFVAIISAVVAAYLYFEPFAPAKTEETTTAQATTAASDDKLLMLAILNGDEGLIDTLLDTLSFASAEILDFAIECADKISYGSIRKIAEKTLDILGSTGLDGLLESTLLGDSARALQELRERENMLMTPSEKLAYFFSVAFCNSEVVDEFVKRGYGVDETNGSGESILQVAEKYGNEGNVEYAKKHLEE